MSWSVRLVAILILIPFGSIRLSHAQAPSNLAMKRELLERFRSPKPSVRSWGLHDLAQLGDDSNGYLIEGLCDDAWEVREQARRLLLSANRETVVPALLDSLSSPHPFVRSETVKCLREIATTDPQTLEWVLPAIEKLRGDESELVHLAVAAALVHLDRDLTGEAAETLLDAISSQYKDVRREAAWAWGRLGHPDASASADLKERLDDTVEGVRIAAAFALANMEATPEPFVGALVTHLRNADRNVVKEVERALVEIGDSTLPVLTPLLADDDSAIRERAAEVIAWAGEPAVKVFRTVYLDAKLRLTAVRGLFRLYPIAQSALPELTAALTDENFDVVSMAAHTLGKMGTNARAAVPVMKEVLLEPSVDEPMSLILTLALTEMGPENIPVLQEITRQGNDHAATAAVAALSEFGHRTQEFINEVASGAEYRETARARAKRSATVDRPTAQAPPRPRKSAPPVPRSTNDDELALIEEDPVGMLRTAVKERDIRLFGRASAVVATEDPLPDHAVNILSAALFERGMGEIAKKLLIREGRGVIPNMMKALTKGNDRARRAASDVLVALGKPSVAKLTNALRHSDVRVRLLVARTLGRIGPSAEKALPGLRRAASRERSSVVRRAMEDAIEQIE